MRKLKQFIKEYREVAEDLEKFFENCGDSPMDFAKDRTNEKKTRKLIYDFLDHHILLKFLSSQEKQILKYIFEDNESSTF